MLSVSIAPKPKPNITPDPTLVFVCVSLLYLCIMQLTLQAADLFREPKGFGVRGGQIARERLNLTLEKDREGIKVN